MKKFSMLSMVGALFALAVTMGAQAASAATFHAFAGTGATATTTNTYQMGNTVMLGQGPSLGALISQKSTQSSGMVSGFDARGNAGVMELSGGLNTQAVASMQGFLHVRGGVNLAGYFVPQMVGSGFQVTPGFALGYTSGLTGNGGNISRTRVTPALSVSYESVRLTYRQSPWSLGNGNHAPRDILAHIYFMGNGMLSGVKGMGVLTLGAVIPDTINAVSDGVVIALKTPRYRGFGMRVAYVGGLQGNAPQGPLNVMRPWDSYSRGVTVGAIYHFKRGVTVGIFEGSQGNSSGSMTATTITQTATQGHEVGVTLSDKF